jgi:hypothetical protein
MTFEADSFTQAELEIAKGVIAKNVYDMLSKIISAVHTARQSRH